MKSDLDELIEQCETEMQFLEKCIDDNIEEGEYLHAHFHSKALFKVSLQLRVLRKFKDPFYDRKVELERLIEIYKKWEKIEELPKMDSYYEKMINDEKKKLEELNKQKNKPLYDDQKIDDALFNLYQGVHKGFILYLNAKDNLSFDFELSGNKILDISITTKNVLNIEYFFDDDKDELTLIDKFKGLGFVSNQIGSKLVYKYDMNNFGDAFSIKILLSRIIYDILAYTNLDNPATLVYF